MKEQEPDIRVDPTKLDWNKGDGLLPAIVQDAYDGAVLMLGYMSRDALDATLSSRLVTFFSRSKGHLWQKGESSGNSLQLVEASADCDSDAILLRVHPKGPTCHKGTRSCFADACELPIEKLAFLTRLAEVIASRWDTDPESSYTSKLLAEGTRRIAQKVGEEGVETALAAIAGDRNELLNESADLLFHLLVLLRERGAELKDVVEVLSMRHKQ